MNPLINFFLSLAVLAFWFSLSFVVYTYFIYPMLIALWARLAPRPVARDARFQPTLSVIVAAYNEEAQIERRIRNLLDQDYPDERYEILVVSDGSTDRTDEILERMAAGKSRVRALTRRANAGKAAALNDAIRQAVGELVVFADARQTFAPDVLRLLAENFATNEIGSASGELILTEGENGVAAQVGLYWRYEKAIRRAESKAGSMLGATGAIYAIRRSLYTPLPSGTLLDDFLTPMRIVLHGRRAIFDDRAVAYDKTSAKAGQEFKRKVRTLAGNFQAFTFEPGLLLPWENSATWFQVWCHKVFRLLVPWALAIMFAASSLAWMLSGAWFFGLATLGQFVFYALAWFGWHAEKENRPMPGRLVSLAYTFTALNLAAALGLLGWLRGNSAQAVWQKAYTPAPEDLSE